MDNSNVFTAYGSEGYNRTKLATSALFLNSSRVYQHLLNTSITGSYPMQAGWSLYFVNPVDRVIGFGGPLESEFTLTTANMWTAVTGWNASSYASGFSTISPSQPDSYTATKAGLHFVSFVPVFSRIVSAYDIQAAIYINSEISLYASYQHKINDEVKSLPVSGTLNLKVGDVVSYRVQSTLPNLRLTRETTRSLVFVNGRHCFA